VAARARLPGYAGRSQLCGACAYREPGHNDRHVATALVSHVLAPESKRSSAPANAGTVKQPCVLTKEALLVHA
jgi:hypothetical protein